jgi:hypothetical protein
MHLTDPKLFQVINKNGRQATGQSEKTEEGGSGLAFSGTTIQIHAKPSNINVHS